MKSEDKRELDLLLKARDKASAEINNLQTALFSSFTIIIGSAIVGILLSLKDLPETLTQIKGCPGIFIFLGIMWAIALFLASISTYIFISCVFCGFTIMEIEKNILKNAIPYGESENHVPNNEANFLQHFSTQLYFPGLLASGYSHKFFPPLFILTLVLAAIVTTVQYFLLSSIQLSTDFVHHDIYMFIISHSLMFSFFSCLLFLIFVMVIVPIFTPHSREVACELQDKEILVISDTLSHLHGTEVSVIGFAKCALQMQKSLLLVGPIEAEGKVVREECERHEIPLVLLPSVHTWFLGQPDYCLANPFPLRFLVLNRTKYIFINAFPGSLGLIGLLLGKAKKKRVIFYYHVYLPKFVESIPLFGKTKLLKGFFKFVTRKFSNMCDLVVVPSNAVCKEMEEWGVVKSKLRVVPTGLDPFFVDPPSQEVIAKMIVCYSHPLILYVGRLSQEKNIELLIYSFDKVLKQYSSATLLIVGKGPEEQKLRLLTKKLGIERFVKLCGFLYWHSLKPLYWAADVFCMPSLGETQGLSILEAKSCQLPCVVLNKVGAGEQIEDGVDGLLVDEKENVEQSAFSFALAIKKILSDKDFSIRIAKEARKRAIQRKNDLSTKELLQLFDTLPD